MSLSLFSKRAAWLLTGLIGAGVIGVGAILASTAPKPPPPIASMQKGDDAFAGYVKDQPPYAFFTARDGQRLAYHLYQGTPGKGVAVLVHGSTGTGLEMHGLAGALQAKGITAYTLDMRGHGLSGPLGNAAYVGQLGDDMHDFAASVAKHQPNERRILIGHSLGGAFILRYAGEAKAKDFDTYLALSPFMGAGTPMDRPNQGGWTDVSVKRIAILSIFNDFGITAFDHLPVIAYAVPVNAKSNRPRFYSHSLLASLALPRDWKAALRSIRQPVQVMIGTHDELFLADKYQSQIEGANSAINVTLIPNVGHMDIVYDRSAVTADVDMAEQMLGA